MQIKGINQRVIKLDSSKETRSADHLYAISAQWAISAATIYRTFQTHHHYLLR